MKILMNKYLTGVQMYFSPSVDIVKGEITVEGEESNHILSVMRRSIGDDIYITNGTGSIFHAKISDISDKVISAAIQEEYRYTNQNKNIVFCLPVLKNPDRFEFALEKCIEFGITEFIVYRAKNSLAKSFKKERWEKISLAALKQSLRSFLPTIKVIDNLQTLNQFCGQKVLLDQSAERKFNPGIFSVDDVIYLIFGPEGGFHNDEIEYFEKENFFSLTKNRLRSETAIILAAGQIASGN